ncbi:MAG: replication-relaxation family protein [Patescibacteria group bacterium]|nr:replication-relaxation family protein [Patescibacteria group bacterium]
MYLNTLDVKLTPRANVSPYNVEINQSALEILALVLEFRLASSCHITRFLSQKERSRYMYTKLRRMWQAKLLESFKVFSGGGFSLFYMLSKQGLKVLTECGQYEWQRLKNYPTAKTLLSWGLFKHEAQIVELASLESLNKSANLSFSFKGEDSSQTQDYISDKRVEALTPDYTVVYKTSQAEYKVYTEFERTRKSNESLLNKVQRYWDFLALQNSEQYTLRLVFQTQGMERSFWLNIFMNRPGLLKLNIVTTHLDLIAGAKQFLEPIYATESTVRLSKDGLLKAEITQRIKLFNFL